MKRPSRGQVWLVNLEPVVGHEQGRVRPALVLSDDVLNHGPSGLVTVLPVTTRRRDIPLHLPLQAGTGGLDQDSWVLCDQVRTISRRRLLRSYGSVDKSVMSAIEELVRVALGL
ncbi:type II toxin-antitoxin system PemK/MazF family toxin [Mucisphaera calidilacus]|uniref:mRNA interferase n=1 Tax=Mucisphaera calidilacus TaxID=2527982 RepID=A0A518C0U1_9BACT|nr:type II toxin-antitoxin system PemK/MazF family toxin [Mucisphaera calidilacus]QDU72843.1 mRNA interferase EndoA [Mucisphaera calidilacus]